jgi:hypothetical protein
MKKVSFDFDSTLSRPEIQQYAKELKENNFDIWIVTSRQREFNEPHLKNLPHFENKDLFEVAEKIGIQRENIIFMNYIPKAEFFLNNEDFVFHLDDDSIELDIINRETIVKGISCWKNTSWRRKCDKILGL